VIFAEPVGSCADLVATVLKPLIASGRPRWEVGRLSVLTDVRLMRQRLNGTALPFSEDVQYIYDSQIEEAEILVLNKVDLLSPQYAQEVANKARQRYPGKNVLLQSSLREGDIQRWLAALHTDARDDEPPSLSIDYERYSHGETGLAWYDAALAIDLSADTARATVERLVEQLRIALKRRGQPVGHLKIRVRHAGGSVKVSITNEDELPPELSAVFGKHLDVTINARAEDSAESLQTVVREGVRRALAGPGTAWAVASEQSFHPSRPKPYVRMA
jgi:G3E family GTPase